MTVNTLVTELSTLPTNASSKKTTKTLDSPSNSVREGSSPSPFSSLMPDNVNYPMPARGHLALIFLAELAFEISDEFLPHLPVILHQVFLGFDSSQPVVFEHCRLLLLNLVDSLVVQHLMSSDQPHAIEACEEALELEEFLKAREGKQLWPNEDISMRRTELRSTKDLHKLVRQARTVFEQRSGTLADDWGTEALSWAISCPSPHLVNRSYQIYRALLPCSARKITPIDLLENAYLLISDRSLENISVSLEILVTLQTMVDTLDSAKLWLFPQIFWAAIALLHTDFEQEYLQAIKLLNNLVTRFNFADIAVQNVYLSYTPKGWEPAFTGLQPLVMRGLLSPDTEQPCIEMLSKFTVMSLSCDKIFEPQPERLLLNILGLVIYLAQHITEEEKLPERQTIANQLADACTAASEPKLARVFSLYAKKHYMGLEAFFEDLYKPFCEAFFPTHAPSTFRYLFSLLEKESATNQAVVVPLTLIRYLVGEVDLASLNIRPKDMANWLSCIARFVATTTLHWREALQVLDRIVHRSQLNVSHMFSTYFRPLEYHQMRKEFKDQVHKGNQRVTSILKHLLKSTDRKDKSNIISPDFFKNFFSTEAQDEEPHVGEEIDQSEKSPRTKFGTMDSDDEEVIGIDSEFQDIFSVFRGGGMGGMDMMTSASPPQLGMQFSDIDGYNHAGGFLANAPEENLPNLSADLATDSDEEREEISNIEGPEGMDGLHDFPSDSLVSASRRWRKLCEQRRFASEADMFEIFPVAGQYLSLLLNDYRERLQEYMACVPTSNQRILKSPVLLAEALDQAIFQQPIPEPKHSVLFTFVCSKYRSLTEANSSFSRIFTSKRAQLVEAFNQQQRIYLELKLELENKKAKLSKEDENDPQYRLLAVQFCRTVLKLHRQMLILYQAHCSLQQLVTAVIDSREQLSEESEEAEKQRLVLEKEMEKNRSISQQLDALERDLQRN